MSRSILCPSCKEKIEAVAEWYNQIFESKEGQALKFYPCDECEKDIEQGDKCFACCLLDNKENVHYLNQKPDVWADKYII